MLVLQLFALMLLALVLAVADVADDYRGIPVMQNHERNLVLSKDTRYIVCNGF